MTSVGKYTLLQELNDREAPTYAARCEGLDGASELVAIERYATDIAADAEDEASLAEAARSVQILTELYHPNLASVRDVVVSSGEVLVVSAFVDGDSYGKLMPAGREKSFDTFSFALKLAIVSDAIEGLAALHEFARAHDSTIVHGGVTPRNVIVCADGRARLVRVCNLFPEQVSPASPTLGYIAPELLDPTRSPEPSVDVFGAGVMLWEVLAGKRLAVQTNAPLLLLKEFDKGPPKGIPHEDLSWAKALIPIVERALSSSDKRYKDAEQMARAMRAVFAAAGEQVKTRSTVKDVASFVEGVSGDRIRERRAELGFSAPLPLTASRATIAPMRSRPSLPELPSMSSMSSVPLPLPPPPARIYLPSLVDADEFSSRSPVPSVPPSMDEDDQDALPAMDQDENLSALAPILAPNDTLIIDEKSRESFWMGGDPTDEREAIKASNPPPGFDDGERKFEDDDDEDEAVSGTAETVLHRTSQGKVEARESAPSVKAESEEAAAPVESSFPPPAAPPPRQSLFEDRRERRPVVWAGVVLAVAAALVFGYGLGRGQKPAAGQAAAAPAPPAPVKAEITNAEPVAQTAAAEPAAPVEPDPPKVDAPAAAKQPATEIELVPEGARSTARRPRPTVGHGGARPSPSEGSAQSGASGNSAPAAAASTTSPAPEPSAAQGQTDGRQKFNPQGI